MIQRRFPLAALVLVPLLVASCEQKTAPTTPAAAPAAAPAAPAASAAPAAPAAAAKPATAGRTIGIELTSPAPVGALQVDITYTGSGRFIGDADAVACESKVDGALSTFNHIAADKRLRAAFVKVQGFAGPVRISECKFDGNPKAEDFTVQVMDSSSPELAPLDPPPSVKVVVD
ncbi:MAG TPA: hypothetical protein VGK20_18635 [Candidatus Binatia bacterium]